MSHFVVADDTTGIIIRWGVCTEELVESQASEPNEVVVETNASTQDELRAAFDRQDPNGAPYIVDLLTMTVVEAV